MTASPRLTRLRRLIPSVATISGLIISVLIVIPTAAYADILLRCDIYGSAGTPCARLS